MKDAIFIIAIIVAAAIVILLCMLYCPKVSSASTPSEYGLFKADSKVLHYSPSEGGEPFIPGVPKKSPLFYNTIIDINSNVLLDRQGSTRNFFLKALETDTFWSIRVEINIYPLPQISLTRVFNLELKRDDKPDAIILSTLTLTDLKPKGEMTNTITVPSNHVYYIYISCIDDDGKTLVGSTLHIKQI